jgi:hypothetical protein
MVYADGSVWVSGGNDEVARFDTRTHEPVGRPRHIPGKPTLLATDGEWVWVGVADRYSVVAIGPAKRTPVFEAPILYGSTVSPSGRGECGFRTALAR